MEITAELATKVRDVVAAGLVRGVGIQEPGKMCVEAAVCYALGMPHGDDPTCVHSVVRSFKIGLNDSNWSSPNARAKGLSRIAIAQLGSDSIDGNVFVKELVLETIKQIVPIALRAAAAMQKSIAHKESLEEHADNCTAITALTEGIVAAYAAYAAAYDEALSIMAEIGVQALIKAGSPGCAFLYLCD